MTAPTTDGTVVASDGRCRNCDTRLQGPHCHACGQPARNPLGRLRDAAAELSEAVFDVDGRVLRTLRDLLVPGRVALNYLAGRRARYLQPLRLFVVLSLLTFFVAHLLIDRGGVRVEFTDMDNSAIAAATTEAQLETARQAQLAILAGKRADLAGQPEAAAALSILESRRADIEAMARVRLGKLREAQAAGLPPPAPVDDFDGFTVNGKRWHPRDNPLRVAWLPDIANDWLNQRVGHGITNVKRYMRDQSALKDAWLAAIPTTLFFLVPVFALLLKLFYVLSRWTWLEHLVVALCSHALMLLSALVAMLVVLATHATALAGAGEAVGGWLAFATAVYLLLMQKKVYRQGWPLTLLKFSVLGILYSLLLGVGAMVALGAVFLG